MTAKVYQLRPGSRRPASEGLSLTSRLDPFAVTVLVAAPVNAADRAGLVAYLHELADVFASPAGEALFELAAEGRPVS